MLKKAVAFTLALMALTGPGAAQSSPAEDDDNRMICRSQRIIGSLTQRQRTCMTRREWRNLADSNRRRTSEDLARATETACRSLADGAC